MAAGRTQPIPTVSSGARAASLGGTRRDLGLDLARAFAVLSLLIPFGYWLQLIPVSWKFWIPQTLVPAEPLFAAILGAAAWRYARTANFPQLFAGTIVRFLALLLLGVALMQGITYLPQADVTVPAQGFSYSLPFDMLVHLALLTLLTLFVVHLPLWAIAVLAVVTSPFITWTYTLLMDVAARADQWTATQLPFLANHGVNHAQSAQLIWVMCLGIVLVRLYDNLQAKLAIPVVLAVLALAVYRTFNPYTELGFLNSPQVLLTLNLAATLYFWAECARLLSAQAGMLTPIARLGQMSLSASIVLSGIIIYAGPTIKAFTVGEHYVATGGWGTAVYWSAFLLLGTAIALGFCTLWARMARSIAGRGPLEAILALISGRG
ncbi:hypothetical protein ACLUU9_00455 [Rothia mucilaginosa]|mgnify:FL=1|jgi:hypothetical protein|uniref:hypothetical protein n=1 Tax=Rothia TaxID=32207 RepID=UPI00066BC8DC|nr:MULTISPECIES: hypothetical protein [Rothia]MBF1672041.1 hypothetical protein [Rothia mucilaginosa]MDU2571256.1 hypothetical protein [Rothia mucilaginosa]OFL51741.1 hypothetical protein HMPREF2765_00470 [Rothia sp. HMSC062H08]OFQ75831.1 hypothetical protein HMPREF2919_01835 [Rothia sp. HMSC068E02]